MEISLFDLMFPLVETLAESISMVGVVLRSFWIPISTKPLATDPMACESQGIIRYPKIQRLQAFLLDFSEREGLSVNAGLTHVPQMSDHQLNEENTRDQPKPDAQPSETGLATSSRKAQIATYCGQTLGVCIFLTESELRELGISLGHVDTDVIEYLIDEENGELVFRLPRNR